MERKTNYQKNTKRRLISTILLFVIIAGIVFSIPVKTVYAAADGSSSGIVTPEVALAIDQSASTFGIGQAFKGLWTMALAVPFLPVFGFISSILMPAANSLFVWAVKVDNFKAVVGSTAVYNIWKIVRDFLNIAFILVLLFSAFATIFQVEKYSYKKILLNLVLMALLVNFSFPIARFIIDVSNVLMYTLISMLFVDGQNGATKAMGMMADKAMLSGILSPSGGTASTIAALLAAIIFGFIFAITMLAVAIMLVIRIIALAILIMFSPIAFVASILPSTSSYANDWWNQLFKYAFFGPIMIFMIYIALMVMTEFSTLQASNFNIIAGSQSEDASFIGQIAYLAIPIVILWLGMGTAQKMSIAGAGAVMGGAQKIIKGVGSQVSGLNYAKRQIGKFQESRKQRLAQKDKKGPGKLVGDWANKKQDSLIAKVPYVGESAKKRLLDTERIKTQEYREEWKKMGGVSEEQIAEALSSQNKDSSKRKAAAMEMAEKVGFKAGDGSNPEANLERYREALKTVGDDPLYKNLFTDKVKEKHIKFVIEDDISKGKSPAEAYKEHLGKLDNEKFAKQKDLHEKIGSDPHLQEYVKERFKTNPESHKELFKRLTGDQQTRYLGVGGGVTPDLPKPPGPQGPQKIYKAS